MPADGTVWAQGAEADVSVAQAVLAYDQRRYDQALTLLDDVLSELDESRRASVLAATDADQIWITSPDPDRFDTAFVATAQTWHITNGRAERPPPAMSM